MGETRPSQEKYQPEIDGLRAVAIVPVVVYHASPTWVPGGFLGVDVFFVISGYLITRLILADLRRGCFSMFGFWERRARRLLPAALLMSLMCWVLGYALLLPSELQRLGEEILSHSLFISNIYFWLTTDYFAPKAELRPLLHTWSLSVEEQFYLLVAPLLSLIWAKWRSGGVQAAVWLITVASLLASAELRLTDRDAAFYLLPSRAWELGLGAILAIHKPVLAKPVASILAACGLAMLLFAYAVPPSGPLPGKTTLLATVGTALMIASASAGNAVTGLLRAGPLVWIGLLSYSLYLWHWPALSYLTILRGDLRTPNEIQAALLVAFVAAVASFYLVERPIRRRQFLKGRREILVAASTAVGVAALVGLVTLRANGFEGRWSDGALQLAQGQNDDYFRHPECTELSVARIERKDFCRIGSNPDNHRGRVVVLGDSHGAAMMALFDEWADLNEIRGWQASRPRCKPLALRPKACGQFSRSALEFIKEKKPTDVVVVGRWEQSIAEKWYHLELARHVQELAKQGIRVWFIRQAPNPGVVVPTSLARAHEFGWEPPQLDKDRYLRTTRTEEDKVIAESLPFLAGVLDPMPFLCNGSRCRVEVDGRAVYTDDNHLSSSGAIGLLGMLAPITDAIPR
jgi:peptidoglycan/LPS O-acetylase OafA/YrhL